MIDGAIHDDINLLNRFPKLEKIQFIRSEISSRRIGEEKVPFTITVVLISYPHQHVRSHHQV